MKMQNSHPVRGLATIIWQRTRQFPASGGADRAVSAEGEVPQCSEEAAVVALNCGGCWNLSPRNGNSVMVRITN
jgi:hypothetical protein